MCSKGKRDNHLREVAARLCEKNVSLLTESENNL